MAETPAVETPSAEAPVAAAEPAGHVGDGLATVTALTWAWGANTVLDFDTALDTLDFGWFAADSFTLSEVNGSTVIAIPSNQQTYTLTDVSLAELQLSNITAKDAGALAEWTAALEAAHAAAGTEAGEDLPAHYDLV
ncbi:MAG: hypothetical protein B7Z15_00460 [Rhizobiales bacterium 32-66-8]|nr:MAG: hypothetical protein B7Z15_00460 [Rhizobiales bacterium 32-66-8]